MFLSLSQIANALNSLKHIHPFFGLTFPVFKAGNLPVGKTIEFSIGHEEDLFLKRYYRPIPNTRMYFRAFRITQKNQFWLKYDYASSGSQTFRTQTFGDAFIHTSGSQEWGWQEGYVEYLKNYLDSKKQSLPAFAIAIWLYHEEDWAEDARPQDLINKFLDQFNITEEEKNALFDTSFQNLLVDNWLQEKKVPWGEVAKYLDIPPPPDLPVDEGGTLSVLEIQGVGPAKELNLSFSERINILTGDNGLGKSFILESAWWALSGNWTSFPVYPREDAERNEPRIKFEIQGDTGSVNRGSSVYDWDSREWSTLEERPAVPGVLIYARVDGAFAVWDPARDYWPDTPRMGATKPLIFSREEVWNGLQDSLGGRTTFLSNGLIEDWILWQNSPEEKPFEILKRVLCRLSPPDSEGLGILSPGKPARIPRDSRWMPTIKHSYGEVPLIYASAGVRRIIALAYLIVWVWQEHQTQSQLIRREPQKRMVILIDEIEAHLHPQWQRSILPAVLEACEELDASLQVQLLVATHSPLVMTSIEPLFDKDKDTIFHFDLVRDELFSTEVRIEEPEFVKYGTVDSWLRSSIFELSQARSLEAEKAIEDAKNLMMNKNATKQKIKEVSSRLIKYLSAHDTFWSRWTFFAKNHGVDL